MLRGENVTRTFGGLTAVDSVNFEVNEKEIVGLIGPNGAGKSTLFNTITAVYPADRGTISLNDTELTGLKPHQIAQAGVARTFQEARTFNESTVLQNVQMGGIYGDGKTKQDAIDRARECLDFVGMSEFANEKAGDLNLVNRKQLELARSIAADPDIILVDEIGSGLTPSELDELTNTLEMVRDKRDIAVFWVEHIMDAIMGTVDRIIVLNQGEKIADGPPSEIRADPDVAEAYLGGVEV